MLREACPQPPADALAHVELAFEGTLHRGLDDALNVARLVQNDEALKAILHG
ncbi:hypothetical protein [Spiribacter vilamensis]|uniref:hypothetical protein n=1 Tax=Spiribacter vilamensis TaxID=531306 RepID=UPI001EF0C273|nr:hypothetical protein [Spiribacter vilamensis]